MIAVYLWAALAIGVVPGIGIGYVFGWTRGHVAGVDAGKASADRWREFLANEAPGYPLLLPHGNPHHVCTTRCRPGG